MIAHLTMFPLNVDDEENFAGDLAAVLVNLPEHVQRDAVEPLLDLLCGLGEELGRLRAEAEHEEERRNTILWNLTDARAALQRANTKLDDVRDGLKAMLADGVDEDKMLELLEELR